MSTTKIFLSVGRTGKQAAPAACGNRRAISANERPAAANSGPHLLFQGQDLVAIKELMHECAPGQSSWPTSARIRWRQLTSGAARKKRACRLIPTVWNQIEATMAYTLGHPLLVVVEDGLKYEGLLETGYDWYVMHIKPNESLLASAEFQGVFADWKRRVLAYQAQKEQQKQRGETGRYPTPGPPQPPRPPAPGFGRPLQSRRPANALFRPGPDALRKPLRRRTPAQSAEPVRRWSAPTASTN